MSPIDSKSFEEERQGDGVLRDLAIPSPVLVVAFGGLLMRFAGEPPFEFFRFLGEHAPVKKMFVRDHFRAWYHRGVRGYADGVPELVDALRPMIAEADVSKTVMVGTSAGGYAALLFGRLLGVDEVHAFGPQTFIDPDLRSRHGDCRFARRHLELIGSGRYCAKYGDLKSVFAATPVKQSRFVVHYGDADSLDVVHAERLRTEQGVELRAYESVKHNVARSMREDGKLQAVVSEMIAL